MSPLDVVWHVANFIAPALGIGMIASFWTKLLWRRATNGLSWWYLCRWSTACSALMLVTGLVVFGRDGKMATYGGMILGCALTLWWTGFARSRR